MNKLILATLLLSSSFCSKAQWHIAPDSIIVEKKNQTQVKLLASDSLSSTFFIVIPGEVKLHFHVNHTENVFVTEGKGVMKFGREEFKIKKGDLIIIPKGTPHSVVSKGKRPLKVISVQSPFFDGKDRVILD